ncbi:tectonic-3 isoform b precursor [Gallus gallus]|uniref:Tectonic family member 3 n=1 Tax=Gallus gallus TaxID=9031 RepID=A0A8V0X6B8_CHICK|nr:tectonic-3 isoform b precursor [Gallus gallus]
MSGALEILLALMLARVVEGGPGTTPGATAELTAGGPRQATHRNEAAAPHRASALRAVRGGAQSPFFPARGLPARGRPPGACGLCRPGAGSSSRLTSSRSVNQVCVEKSLIFRTNIPYHTDTIAVSDGPDLFCVQLDDRFLESKSTSCTRIFTNLSGSCVSDPALNAASYYRDFSVLKVPINDTIAESMKVRISPIGPPGAPYMEDNVCNNAVSEVIYEIEFNGTYGIQSVSVQFKVTSISGSSGFSLQQQHFTLRFWTRMLPHTLPRSGNPGYITGAPLLIANDSAVQHMSILQSEGDGSCSQFLRHTVRFGSNTRTGCKLRLTQMEESNCSYIQLKLYKAFQGMNQAEDLAIIGSARSTQEEEWVTILIQNCSVQIKNCSSCCMIPVTLDIQILWTKMGLLSNPQAQIVGVRYFYQCQPLKSLSTGMVPLTTVVTFTDMTEWPEPPRGLPKVHWKLPFDFFFPFKMVLSIERSYRDDLTAYFVVILILSSILCF